MGKKRQHESRSVRMLGHDEIERMYQHGAGSHRQKHLDKHDEEHGQEAMDNSIYSRKTGSDYRDNWNRYCDAMRDADFRVDGHRPRTLAEAAQYMPYYLKELESRPGRFGSDHLSAWTVRAYFAAPAKVLGLSASDYNLPSRYRDDVQRSRGNHQTADFSLEKNWDLVEFQRCVGARHFKELTQITGRDLVYIDGHPCIHVHGKGGRERDIPITGRPDEVQRVVDRLQAAGSSAVWPADSIPKHYDVHADRAYYACKVYLEHARPLEDLHWKEKHYCRGQLKGLVYDKAAMEVASQALGHSRTSVIAESYLWRLEEVKNDLQIH